MNILVPSWFYGFDSFVYLLSALVGFTLSLYFHKIHSLSSIRRHEYFYFGFLLFSIGLFILAVSSVYSYVSYEGCTVGCKLGILDDTFSMEDFAYMMYFGFSLLAYLMFIFAYEHEDVRLSKIFALLFIAYLILISLLLAMQRSYKIWHSYSEYFHLTALMMLVFISFRALTNFYDKRNLNSFLVVMSFGLIAGFHLFYLFSSVDALVYVIAHGSMLAGFITLLAMVATVRKK
ncbi:MAG: hypothetical protein HYW24_00820 [Candidatus Aenigmarchaeota archaeon]|nr:hypothetical protein [Candidatus Aenigmarchaeota archaeon]